MKRVNLVRHLEAYEHMDVAYGVRALITPFTPIRRRAECAASASARGLEHSGAGNLPAARRSGTVDD